MTDIDDATLTLGKMLPTVGLTPTGTQSLAALFRRRLLVAALNSATFVLVTVLFGLIISTGGWTWLDILLLIAFMISTPWTILGVWNALIGLWLLHGGGNAIQAVAPYALQAGLADPITARIAVLMTLRNEDPERAFTRLRIVRNSLEATAFARHFSYFVLSDSDDAHIATMEDECFAGLCQQAGDDARLHYRRRTSNPGFKAGNIRDFLANGGSEYDMMIGLDADSLMGADSILRLVRIMQANPKLGILQSLVVGMPSQAAFARLFQFGMRHGMRAYTMGACWWAGDCGPYWGHNAVLRVAPFTAHAELPILPGKPPLGGYILSHDQIEAAFMRRAGYEVRVLPEEMQSYEENPPHLLEFTRRDLRWCQGNMQYWRLLGLPGLLPLSRFQLSWAIAMYFGSFAWMAFTIIGTLSIFTFKPSAEPYPASLGIGLFLAMMLMSLVPKIAGVVDIFLRPGGAASYGGRIRLLVSALIEFLFGMLLGPIIAVRVTIFLIGLLFGQTATWSGQARDAQNLSWSTALRGLWPQMLFGLAITMTLAIALPTALWWALPMLVGLLLAVPFAVLTAHPAVGRWLQRHQICAIPEEIDPPAEIAALNAASGVLV